MNLSRGVAPTLWQMIRYLLTGIVGYLAGAPITVWLTDHAGGFLHSLLPIFPGYVAAGALVYGGVGCVELTNLLAKNPSYIIPILFMYGVRERSRMIPRTAQATKSASHHGQIATVKANPAE